MDRFLLALTALIASVFLVAPAHAQGYFEPYEAENSIDLEAGGHQVVRPVGVDSLWVPGHGVCSLRVRGDSIWWRTIVYHEPRRMRRWRVVPAIPMAAPAVTFQHS